MHLQTVKSRSLLLPGIVAFDMSFRLNSVIADWPKTHEVEVVPVRLHCHPTPPEPSANSDNIDLLCRPVQLLLIARAAQ